MSMGERWVTIVGNEDEALRSILLARSLRFTRTNRPIFAIVSIQIMRNTDLVFRLQKEFDFVHWTSEKSLAFGKNANLENYAKDVVGKVRLAFLDCNFIALRNMDMFFGELSGNWNLEDFLAGKENLILRIDMNGILPTALDGNKLILISFFTSSHPVCYLDKGSCPNFAKLGPLEASFWNYCEKLWMDFGYPKASLFTSELNDSIAIVGMGCRFPGATSLDEFWNLLEQGMEKICRFPQNRVNQTNAFGPIDFEGGFLNCHPDKFDPAFFGVNVVELATMDPQQHYSLMIVWEALENAGIDPNSLRGGGTGVFGGWYRDDYKFLLQHAGIAENEALRSYLGTSLGALTARVSHFLELTGPSVAIESACSTAMVGVHLAIQSLQQRETDLALALAVNLILHPANVQLMSGVVASDGRCKTFDAGADGFGRAEGVGALVLKRFPEALADGDRIWGIIRGSAIAQEGTSQSLGTPTVQVEAQAMELALKRAGVEPAQVSYVEMHGTGTAVGDPLEVQAVARSYSKGRDADNPLTIGSVKTNIGHSEPVSGIAGIIKTILALKHEIIPRNLNLKTLNPEIDLTLIPAQIPLQNLDWKRGGNQPRIAGVSSYGITGTDAHVIIQEPPEISANQFSLFENKPKQKYIFTISGKSEEGLQAQIEAYLKFFQKLDTDSCLADIERTMHIGRAHHKFRRAIVASNREELLEDLKSQPPSLAQPMKKELCFLFTGQGSQYSGMGEELYEHNLVFKTNFEYCDSLLQSAYGFSIKAALWEENNELLKRSLYSQVSIFVIEYCLLKLWTSWGVRPTSVLGHSLGEFTAAVAANILNFEDALKLVVYRSKLIDELPNAGMLAVGASLKDVEKALEQAFRPTSNNLWLDIAAVNSEDQTVLAGPTEAIQAFILYAKNNGIKTTQLASAHAYHSRLMEPMLEGYGKIASKLNYKMPAIPFISGMEGAVVDRIDGSYWLRHTRERVRFLDASTTAISSGINVYLELGPHPVLSAMVHITADYGDAQVTTLASLRRSKDERDTMLSALAKLYTMGHFINWENYHRYSPAVKVDIPTTVFKQSSHWLELNDNGENQFHRLLGRTLPNPSESLLFRNEINTNRVPFLADHAIKNRVIFPGAGYLEMALVAGYTATNCKEGCFTNPLNLKPKPISIQNFSIVSPALLHDKIPKEFQTLVTKGSEINIFTKLKLEDGTETEFKWIRHAGATYSRSSSLVKELTSLEELKKSFVYPGPQINYEIAAESGYTFGPIFRILVSTLKASEQKEDETLLSYSLDKEENLASYFIHPSIIDAMFQAQIVSFLTTSQMSTPIFSRTLHVPVSVERFTWWGHPPTHAGYIFVSPTSTTLFDESGNIVASMVGTEFSETTINNILAMINSNVHPLPPMYDYVWREEISPTGRRVDEKLLKYLHPLPLNFGTMPISDKDGISSESFNQIIVPFIICLLGCGLGDKQALPRILILGEESGELTQQIVSFFDSTILNQIKFTLASNSESKLKEGENICQPAGLSDSNKFFRVKENSLDQGFLPEFYDLILVAGGFTEGIEIEDALQNILKLLRPHGSIVLLENLKKEANPGFENAIEWQGNNGELEELGNILQLKCGLEEFRYALQSNFIISAAKKPKVTRLHIKQPLGTWIIFGNPGHESEEVTDFLAKLNYDYELFTKQDFGSSGTLEEKMGFELTKIFSSCNVIGIIYLWGILPEFSNIQEICEPYLYLCKYLCSSQPGTSLYTFTKGAIGPSNQQMDSPKASPLIGMSNTLLNECPSLRIKCVDIDPSTAQISGALWEIFTQDEEIVIAYRAHNQYLHRLIPRNVKKPKLSITQGQNYYMKLPASNLMSELSFEPLSISKELDDNELEIEVKAYSLNFKDIFVILKPIPFFEQFNTVGLDYAGIVSRVGKSNSCSHNHKVGDAVFGSRPHGPSLASRIILPAQTVFPIPHRISYCDAAGLPTALLTAVKCLVEIAQLKKGQTLLIHTASGGVGLAALQIGRLKNCRIVATAGSERKRAYLRQLGIQHVFNSRNTNYQEEIRAALGGAGVDVVLNSLTSPGFKEATLQLCAQGATFVEMSKLNIWTKEDVFKLRPDVFYETVDLSNISEREYIEEFQLALDFFNSYGTNSFRPLPYTQFDLADVQQALQYFQQALQIGKVVLRMPEFESGRSLLFNSTSSYLITGGLGGIGLELLKWMVDSGASHLIIVSRSPKENHLITELMSKGIQIITRKLDVGNYDECRALFKELEADDSVPQIRGIIHAASTFNDATFENQSWEIYQDVFNAKIGGGWNLHKISLTFKYPLEHFIVFSSCVSSVGSIAQSAYTAANQYLDSLISYRNSRGLPGITINWGQWGQIGTVGNITVPFLKPIMCSQGLLALDHILRSNVNQLTVCDLDVQMARKISACSVPLLSEIEQDSSSGVEVEQIDCGKFWDDYDLQENVEGKISIVSKTILNIIKVILKLKKIEDIDESSSFLELGMDSLLIVEMKNMLQTALGKRMPLTIASVKDCKTPAQLSVRLVQLISGEKEEVQTREQFIELVRKDSILPENIKIICNKMDRKLAPCSTSSSILLTGVTGNLGIYVLKEILKRSQVRKIYCIIRASKTATASQRLEQILNKKNLSSEINMGQVCCLPGDVTKSRFGLDEMLYDQLSKEVDCIFNAAAKINWTDTYTASKDPSTSRNVNLSSLKHVLEFAVCKKLKYIFQASSMAAEVVVDSNSGCIREDWPTEGDFDNMVAHGYGVSKYVGDLLCKQVAEAGIPVKVFRFSNIGGDSEGRLPNIDIMNNLLILRLMIYMKLGAMPAIILPASVFPVNLAAEYAVELAFDDEIGSGVFNVYNPHVADEREFDDVALKNFGVEVEVLEPDEFNQRIKESDEEGDIKSLLTFALEWETDISIAQNNLAEVVGAWLSRKEDFFMSKKLSRFYPGKYPSEMAGSWELIVKDLKYAKEMGIFEKLGINSKK